VVRPLVDRMAHALRTSSPAIASAAAYCFAVQNLPNVTSTASELDNALIAFRKGIA
jgi:hypothetical protein